jgi:Domain of unknown function (DUF1771)
MGQTVSNWTSAFWEFLSPPKPDEPGYSNRQAAFSSAKLAQTASSQSPAAYKQNNHQEARKFSDLSKKHWKEYDRLKFISRERNIQSS